MKKIFFAIFLLILLSSCSTLFNTRKDTKEIYTEHGKTTIITTKTNYGKDGKVISKEKTETKTENNINSQTKTTEKSTTKVGGFPMWLVFVISGVVFIAVSGAGLYLKKKK